MRFGTDRVEALLSETFGEPVQITSSYRLTPWSVVRCHLARGAADVPTSVVVKALRNDPSGTREDPLQVCTERAALEFVAELGLRLAPRLLANDLEAGLLVLEDLAPRIPQAEVLKKGDSRTATEGPSAFARALGTLNATSSGHEAVYYRRRRALGPVDPREERLRFVTGRWTQTRAYMESLDVAPSPRAEGELVDALAELSEPGPFLAFSSGDAGANNYLLDGMDGRLIDFEFAGYRHALTDAVCLYVPGPFWITVSDPIANGLESEYRGVLSSAVPEASDDVRFGFGAASACLVYAISRLHRFPLLEGRRSGDHSRVQMISTLEAAANAAESHRSLPHIRGWVREVASTLRRIWPDADLDLSTYPRYAPRGREAR